MADYVLSAKGTYDGSDMDKGFAKSKKGLEDLKSSAKSIGGQVGGFFKTAFGSAAKTITSTIGLVTAGVTTLAATGGMRRALNIEQAQTMFKGMKLEWGDYYQTIMDSVDGTAYGFDVAAQAAAQLAASGVSAGSDMEKALNGCVGTTATFGQDLGDLSSIWAKVAASGKLSGEQVQQFSDRGINAVSVLSQYLGKSSDEVSQMVSKGKIDFETFSNAMYAAFGDSAKAANETFSGSLANTKAALSKVGQDWMTPLKDSAIPVFNSIRNLINSVRDALKPASAAFAEFLGVSYDAQGNLTRTGGAVEKVCSFIDSLSEKVKGVDLSNLGTGGKVAAAGLAVLAGVSLSGLIGQIPIVGELANGLTGNLVPGIKGTVSAFLALPGPAKAVVVVITALIAVFAQQMTTNEEFRNSVTGIVSELGSNLAPVVQSTMDGFRNFGQTVADVVSGLDFSGLSAGVQSMLQGVADGIQNFMELVSPVGDILAEAFANPAVQEALQHLVDLLGMVAQVVGVVASVLGTVLGAAVQAAVTVFAQLIVAVAEVINGIADFVAQLVQFFGADVPSALQTMGTFFQTVFGTISNVVTTVWNAMLTVVTTVLTAISTVITTVLGAIATVVTTVWTGILTVITTILNVITAVVVTVWNALVTVISVPLDIIAALVIAAWTLISTVTSAVWGAISATLTAIWTGISSVATPIFQAIGNAVTAVWSTVQSVTSAVWGAISGFLSGLWSGISSTASSVFNAVRSVITAVWSGVQSVTSSIWNGIRGLLSGIWNGLTSLASSAFNAVRSTVSGVWNAIGSTTTSVWNGLRGTLSGIWNGIRSTASSVFNGVKNAIVQPIESARNTLQGIANRIASIFSGIHISIPHIPLPHLSVSGSFSVIPPSVPSFGISWYRRGMGAFDQPALIGVGDAPETEFVLRRSQLMDMGHEAALAAVSVATNANGALDGAGSVSNNYYTMGDVTIDASSIQEFMTMDEFFRFMRRAKAGR